MSRLKYPVLNLNRERRRRRPLATRRDNNRGHRGAFNARELLVARFHVSPRGPDDGFGPRLARVDLHRALASGERERLRNAIVDAVDRTLELDVTRDGGFLLRQSVERFAAVQATDSGGVDVRGQVRVERTGEIKRLLAVVFNDERRLERAVRLQRHRFLNLKFLIPHSLGVLARGQFHRHRRFVAVLRVDERPVDVSREPVRLNRTRAKLRPAVRQAPTNRLGLVKLRVGSDVQHIVPALGLERRHDTTEQVDLRGCAVSAGKRDGIETARARAGGHRRARGCDGAAHRSAELRGRRARRKGHRGELR
mmetsp:Transcript_3238/g.11695  ORF Transcript_3238/g.11695 Transcript_3238/m.11695 type:complete len:309 (+) Transcript_3238:1634-2560(+)